MPPPRPVSPPLALPAMGCHVLLVTGLSGNGLDPCVDKIASCLLRLDGQDEDHGDDSEDEEWRNHGGAFANRRSSFDRSAGLSPSPSLSPPRPKKLMKCRYGTGAGQESVEEDDGNSRVEREYDSEEDEAIVQKLADRCHHPSRSLANLMPCIVHVVETPAELDDIGVEMDHVVLIHRDLDTVPVAAALPSPTGGASSRMSDRRDANGTAATTGTTSTWLSAEDRRALRRNMLVKDWQRRVSRVRIVNQPFAATQHRHDGAMLPPAQDRHRGNNHEGDNNNQHDGIFEIPTFVCHEYDPGSIRQVARILRKIARTRPMPRTTLPSPAPMGAPA